MAAAAKLAADADGGARSPVPVVVAVTILTGLGAGVGGMLLALLLHLIQHLAYGYSLGAIISSESFLQGVSAATPERRVLVLLGCGCLAGVGWWAIARFGSPLISIGKAIRSDDPRLPPVTLIHDILQITAVALGSPLGREVAPREVGASFAGWLSHRAGLTVRESRIMVACGAGAGLAAVYNVPFSGALFVLEVLTGSFAPAVAVPAFVTSIIAATVAWIGLGDERQYMVPHEGISASLVLWAIIMGPVFGVLAYGFVHLTTAARARSPKDWRLIPSCLLVFGLIGLAATAYPQLLGNGRGPIQMGFEGEIDVGLACALLVLKVVATSATLRAGAAGGLLTPGMTIGALIAIVSGGVWTLIWPGVPSSAFAVVGAAAFLAASQSMPVTAVALVVEFTRIGHDFLVPVLCAVAGSTAAFKGCEHYGRALLSARVHTILMGRPASAVPDDGMLPELAARSDHPP